MPDLPDTGKASIHATHSEMCKFRDEDSPGWNTLAGCLCDFVAQAPAVIGMKWAQEDRRNLQAKQDLVSNIIQYDIHADVGLSPPPIMPRTRSPSPDAGTSRRTIMGQGDTLFPDSVSEPEDSSRRSSSRERVWRGP